jgi:hypothetical protein
MAGYETKLLEDTQVIVQIDGMRASIAKRLDHRNFADLAKRKNIPPPRLSPLPPLEMGKNPNWQGAGEMYHRFFNLNGSYTPLRAQQNRVQTIFEEHL